MTIIGKITHFDLHYTSQGSPLANATLENGTRLVFWEDLAEGVAQTDPYIAKIYTDDEVPQVELEGYFKKRTWKDSKGQEKSVEEFTVKSVKVSDGRFYAQRDKMETR